MTNLARFESVYIPNLLPRPQACLRYLNKRRRLGTGRILPTSMTGDVASAEDDQERGYKTTTTTISLNHEKPSIREFKLTSHHL